MTAKHIRTTATPPDALVMAPVSPAVARLLHQLQAEIIRQADAQVPEGAAVVLPMPARMDFQDTYESHGYRRVICRTADWNYQLTLQTPCAGNPEWDGERPGVWYGSEERVDTNGRTWKSCLPTRYVTDDFGQLVPAGGAQ